MSAYEITLLLHIILFCYWLGGDVGVFYSSKFVVDPNRSQSGRLTAAKIMLDCDLLPRICMSLMLTVGGLLSYYMGIHYEPWQLAAIILLGPFWLAMVLTLHFAHNAKFIPLLSRFDIYFRWLLIAIIVGSCIHAYSTDRLDNAPWLIIKLLGFAFLIFCGLMIRLNMGGFINTYTKLLSNTHTDDDNIAMISSLNRMRPWVVTIWVILVIQAAVGIAKPMF
jgi:hypothetical protein